MENNNEHLREILHDLTKVCSTLRNYLEVKEYSPVPPSAESVFMEWFDFRVIKEAGKVLFIREAYKDYCEYAMSTKMRPLKFPNFKKALLELEIIGILPGRIKLQRGIGHRHRTRSIGYKDYSLRFYCD